MGKAMTHIWVCALVFLVLCGIGTVDAGTRRRLCALVATRCEQAEIAAAKLYREARRPICSTTRARTFYAAAGLSTKLEQSLARNSCYSLLRSQAHGLLRQIERSLLQGTPERARARYLSRLGHETLARWAGMGSPALPTPGAGPG